MQILIHHGYRYVQKIYWIKLKKRGFIKRSIGYYGLHSAEELLAAVKGKVQDISKLHKMNTVIVSKKRAASQKLDGQYIDIETLVPHGSYLEVFGRKNNIRY
jgi:mRNA (2'-O-methyladenosine-N6-)-methyltransferase